MKSHSIIRVTRQFNFEMGHALHGYDGPCKNIHGHSYQLYVTVAGEPVLDTKNPKLGMVMDFSDMKKVVNEHIIKVFDHALVLNEGSPVKDVAKINPFLEKIIVVKFQPTCENLLMYFAGILGGIFKGNVQLHHLKLRETSNSFAEWFSEDNEK